MRIRTLLTLSTGAAVGAGAMYLLDPVHGPQRRRDARRTAVQRARRGAVRLAADAGRRAEEMVVAAAVGYRHARHEDEPDGREPASPARAGLGALGRGRAAS